MSIAIVTEALSDEPLAWLGQRCSVVKAPVGSREFDDLASECNALIVRTYTTVDAMLLDRLPNLKVVARAGVALDNIDVKACRDRGVEVVHAPGANSTAVAEYVFALLFDALRPRVFLDRSLDQTQWEQTRGELIARRQLRECVLGIWGFGRIGKLVARAARAFDVETIYHDVVDVDEDHRHGATPVTREVLLKQSDIVTVHVDDRPTNRGLVDVDAFGRMKSDVVFLNCARGLIVDPVACAEFFVAHPSALAMLDVHDPEPFGPTHPLLDIQNVHLAPHIAAATEFAKTNMSWVVRDVDRVLRGDPPEHPAPTTAIA
ncbi:MAG: NAD(P)-dependent oxidoreductase [Planctomycetota bacterium]